jgi:hypothetical protein
MSLVAPVEEYDSPCSQCCGCSPGAAIPPEYWTFPQAWKLSTALLGRNRSGSGGVGPGSPPSDRATWGQPPKYVERKAECHDDTASPPSGPSTRAAAANADMRAHPCPTHPCWAAQSKTCTSRGQSITRTRRDAQRPRKRASARPSPPDLVATHRRDRARRELASGSGPADGG